MIPIRKNELEYLEKYVKDKFIDRRKKIESEIHLETNKAIDKNFKSFLAKLDIDKDLNAIEVAKDKLDKFQDSKDNYENKLSGNISILCEVLAPYDALAMAPCVVCQWGSPISYNSGLNFTIVN